MSEDPEQQPLTGPDRDDDGTNDAPTESDSNPEDEGEEVPEVPDDVEEMAFEDAVEELEAIVTELEDGDLPLEDAMERFERGLGLVEACRSKLEQAELKVEELLDDGSTRELEGEQA